MFKIFHISIVLLVLISLSSCHHWKNQTKTFSPVKNKNSKIYINNLTTPSNTQRNVDEKTKDLSEWKLVWNDEFDGEKLDTTKWNVVDWAPEKNNELQYYSPNEVLVKNGCLRIRSQKKFYKGRKYTSGAIETKGKFSILYGKIEIRARLPKGKGIFPAFWLLPENGEYLPEIDIMELLGHEPNKIWMVCHWTEKNQKKRAFSYYTGPDYSKDFHLFALEWYPEKLVWSIDKKEVFFTTEYSPNILLYLYINTAIGGNWPGSPDETTKFPQFLDIDYVRIYKKKN